MIAQTIVAAAVGILAGIGADALLRGRDPRSGVVIACGLAGALAGAAMRYAGDPSNLLMVGLSAALGGLLLAFIVRVRISARLSALL